MTISMVLLMKMMKMKKDDDCFCDEETSNVTTTFSSSGTTSSPTPPTNYADTSIPQYQEKPGPTTQLSGAEPVIYFKHLWTDTLSNEILRYIYTFYCNSTGLNSTVQYVCHSLTIIITTNHNES